MADIILAECGGTTWLVEGIRHMDDLMRNMLPASVTISFVTCATTDEALAMWAERNGADEEENPVPWMINPAIVRRIRATLEGPAITFAPWSAMLDADAEQLLAGLADRMAGRTLLLRQFAPAEPPPGLADLQRLRGMLVSAALVRAGADAALLTHATAEPAKPDDANRIEFVTPPSTTG